MKIAIGCDHRGIQVKTWVISALEDIDVDVVDCGVDSAISSDYPDIAVKVARIVSNGQVDHGILICGTGIGMSIAANKIHGIRAALCVDQANAELARQHNNANVLCLASNNATEFSVRPVVAAFVKTDFEGGRHAQRVEKINDLDNAPVTKRN